MLEASKLHKIYHHAAGKLHVLNGIELEIKKGEFVAILGPSGAGKTTLVHLLGGLDYPTQGKILLDGKDIYSFSDSQLAELRNSQIGFIFQFYHLLAEFNALENVLLPALIKRKRRKKTKVLKQEALDLLKQVGLNERIRHFPSQLSGGERQRLAIARALINQPELLFCDEPTGNLDSATGSQIIALIKQLNELRRMTVVLVTHNQELAQAADRFFYLKDGRLNEGLH